MSVTKEATIQRWIGLSTDTKPTSVPVGATFYEYDTKLWYKTYDGTNWSILALDYGLIFHGTCNAGMTASTTAIACADMAGFGNDLFNTQYYMQVIKNANSIGAAPDGEVRKITDYVSTSGTFTVDAFSANVEASDEIVVMHKSIMLILTELPEAGDWALADYDLFNIADADANNERWNVGYISGANGGSADINTSTSGMLHVHAAYNVAGAERYAVSKNLPFYADFMRVEEDITCTWGSTASATPKAVGIGVSAGTAYDATNYIFIERQKGTGINRIQVRYVLNGAAEVTSNVNITDDAIAFKIERLGQTWALFYSTIQAEEGNEDWVKVCEVEDPTNYMTNQYTFYQECFNGAAGDANETAIGDFDNFYYWLGTGGGSQYIAGDYDSTWVAGDVNGSVFERIEAIQAGLQVVAAGTPGIGFEEDGTGLTLYKALVLIEGEADAGSDTTTLIDAAKLGAFDDNDLIGHYLLMISGDNAGIARPIYDNDQGDTDCNIYPAFPNTIDADDKYVILTRYQEPVPAANATSNLWPSDVIGNKTDGPDYTYTETTSSLVKYIKGILGSRVIGEGEFTTSSATSPVDSAILDIYGDDYYNGCYLMPIAGADVLQPRLIVDFVDLGAGNGNRFEVDPDHPFTAATGLVYYIIITAQGDLVTGADSTNNYTVMDMAGNKTDTVVPAPSATASLAGYTKAIAARGMGVIKGTVSSEVGASETTQFYSTDLIGFGNDYFNEEFSLQIVYTTDGAAPIGETREITDYVSLDGHFTVGSVFSANVNTGDKVCILHKSQLLLIPTIAADMTAEVPDGSPLSRVITSDGDTSGYDLADDSLEAISDKQGDTDQLTIPTRPSWDDVNKWWEGNQLSLLQEIVQQLTGGNAIPAECDEMTEDYTLTRYLKGRGTTVDAIWPPDTAGNSDLDGSVLHKLSAIIQGLGVVDGAEVGFEDDGTGHNLYEVLVAVQGLTTGAGTTTTFADTARVEGADYWNGNRIVSLTGSAAGQVRTIVDDDGAGVLTVEPALSAAPGAPIAYVILKQKGSDWIIGDNNNNNAFNSSAVVADDDGSVLERLEHLKTMLVVGEGTFTTSSATEPIDNTRTEGNDYWNGCLLMPLTGSVAFQPRLIVDYDTATDKFYIDPNQPFTVATGTVAYVILANQGALAPAADQTESYTTMDVVGNKADAAPAMNAASVDTDSVVMHLKALRETVGQEPADADDSLHTVVGQRDTAATADDMSDIASTAITAKIRLILNRLSADAFTATIQGSARTALDTMMAQLATYLSPGGAAWSVQVNNQTARTNLEQVIEDFLTVIGCNDANVFDPAMFGGSQTTLEAAIAALGTALGVEFDGTPNVYDVLVTGLDSSGIGNNFDGGILQVVKSGLEQTTGGAYDPDTDSNEALAEALALVPKITSVGVKRVSATTENLQQIAGNYDLFTGTAQAVILESLVLALPNVNVSDDVNITSISVQTDDVTPSVIISSVDGVKANLTAEAQLAYTGAIYIAAGTKIQLTIAGGAADAATVCNVVATCRAVVAGGYLA